MDSSLAEVSKFVLSYIYATFSAFGFLLPLLVSLVLLRLSRRRKSELLENLGAGLVIFSLLWITADGINWLATHALRHSAVLGERLVAWSPTIAFFRNEIASTWGWLDQVFAPATANMCLALAIVGLMFLMTRDASLSRRTLGVKGALLMLLLLIATARTMPSIIQDPLLAVPMIGLFLGTRSAFGSRLRGLDLFSKRHERSLRVKGTLQRNYGLDLPILASLLWMILASIWYSVTITAEVQMAFYAAALGGLLAVIGFAALVFTFSFEQLRTARRRQDLAKSTSDFQESAVPVIVASIFGLLTSARDLDLGQAGSDAWTSVRVAIALCAFSGLLISTHLILRTFREVTLGLAKVKPGDARLNVFVEESLADSGMLATSPRDTGLMELSHILEDEGCNITSIDGVSPGALLSEKRVLLLLPHSAEVLPPAVFASLGRVVANGGILWVMTDVTDWPRKRGILAYFGFPDPVIAVEERVLPVIALRPGGRFGRISGEMSGKMSFEVRKGVIPIVSFSRQPTEKDTVTTSPMVAMPVEYGWVVVSTSSKPFLNATLKSSNDSRLVTDILQVFCELLPLGQRNVATKMQAEFAKTASKQAIGVPSDPGAHGESTAASVERVPTTEPDSPLLPFDNAEGTPLTVAEIEALVARLDRAQPSSTMLLAANGAHFTLPFYPDGKLHVFRNDTWQPNGVRRYALEVGSDLIMLEGNSTVIHTMNALHRPTLTKDTVLHYLAFFCYFVHGDEGPFLILDRLDSSLLPQALEKSVVANAYRAPEILAAETGADWVVAAAVYYSNVIFHAEFVIRPDGMVQMRNDRAVLTGLSVSMTAPLTVSSATVH